MFAARRTPVDSPTVESAEPLLEELVRRATLPADPRRALLSLLGRAESRTVIPPDSIVVRLVTGLTAAFPPIASNVRSVFDPVEFWRHGLATACSARMIAERSGRGAEADAAFIGGLLHDIGKLGLAACFPKAYARVAELARRESRALPDIELDRLGVDHAVSGRRLALAWRLPEAVVNAIWLHHKAPGEQPHSAAGSSVLPVVQAANEVAHRSGFAGWSFGRRAGAAPVEGEAPGGLDWTALREIAAQVPTALAGLERDIAFAPPTGVTADWAPRTTTDPVTPPGARGMRELLFAVLDARDLPDDPASACRHLAATIQRTLGPKASVVFVLPRGARHARASCAADEGVSDTRISIPDLTETRWRELVDSLADGVDTLAVRPPELAAIEERFARALADDSPVMVVFPPTDELLGGAFWSRHQAAPDGDASPRDRAAFASACGLVLSAARARAEARRRAETLVAAKPGGAAPRPACDPAPLEALAQMAAGAAHELNNPLAVIAGRAQLLRDPSAEEDITRNLDIINEQSRRAAEIVSDLLAFARPAPPTPRTVRVRDWAQGLRQCWQRSFGLRPEQIVVEISDPALAMYVDPAQLDEAAGAILANAVEAGPAENARVVINSISRPSDDTVVVSIADNGRGMPPAVLQHALTPFFSHRPAGRGRGLGLPRAARLVEVNGGRLWIESQSVCGTTVYLAVPARPGVGQ